MTGQKVQVIGKDRRTLFHTISFCIYDRLTSLLNLFLGFILSIDMRRSRTQSGFARKDPCSFNPPNSPKECEFGVANSLFIPIEGKVYRSQSPSKPLAIEKKSDRSDSGRMRVEVAYDDDDVEGQTGGESKHGEYNQLAFDNQAWWLGGETRKGANRAKEIACRRHSLGERGTRANKTPEKNVAGSWPDIELTPCVCYPGEMCYDSCHRRRLLNNDSLFPISHSYPLSFDNSHPNSHPHDPTAAACTNSAARQPAHPSKPNRRHSLGPYYYHFNSDATPSKEACPPHISNEYPCSPVKASDTKTSASQPQPNSLSNAHSSPHADLSRDTKHPLDNEMHPFPQPMIPPMHSKRSDGMGGRVVVKIGKNGAPMLVNDSFSFPVYAPSHEASPCSPFPIAGVVARQSVRSLCLDCRSEPCECEDKSPSSSSSSSETPSLALTLPLPQPHTDSQTAAEIAAPSSYDHCNTPIQLMVSTTSSTHPPATPNTTPAPLIAAPMQHRQADTMDVTYQQMVAMGMRRLPVSTHSSRPSSPLEYSSFSFSCTSSGFPSPSPEITRLSSVSNNSSYLAHPHYHSACTPVKNHIHTTCAATTAATATAAATAVKCTGNDGNFCSATWSSACECNCKAPPPHFCSPPATLPSSPQTLPASPASFGTPSSISSPYGGQRRPSLDERPRRVVPLTEAIFGLSVSLDEP